MEEFSVIMNEWLGLDTEIKEYQTVIKEKKQRQNKLSEYIITFMNSQNKQVCNVDNHGSLVVKTRKTTTSLKRKDFLDFFNSIFEDEEKAKKTLDELYDKRKTTEKHYLKLNVIE